jgi:hypothetical protein
MKMTLFESILLAGLLGCCSGTQANHLPSAAPRAAMLPVKGSVEVKEVRGAVEYAYDGTGWRNLAAGKRLRAGATVRASAGSVALLKVEDRGSFVRVCAATTLHLTTQTPEEEQAGALIAAR